MQTGEGEGRSGVGLMPVPRVRDLLQRAVMNISVHGRQQAGKGGVDRKGMAIG